MPLVEYDEVDYTASAPQFRPIGVDSAGDDWLAASFRLENDVYNAYEWANRPSYERDVEFDWSAAFAASTLAQSDPKTFYTAGSAAEFEALELQLAGEQNDRNIVESAGWAGIAAQFAAGILSPTIFLPGGALVRGRGALKTATSVAAWSTVAVGAQESVLQANQLARTKAESAFNIGGAAILGGILGGVVGAMRPRQFDELASRMGTENDPEIIQSTTPPSAIPGASSEAFTVSQAAELTPGARADLEVAPNGDLQPAGAQITPEKMKEDYDAGGVEKAFGLERVLARMNPIIRGISQPFSVSVRRYTAWMGGAGIKQEGNVDFIPGAVGGNIETLVKQWDNLTIVAKQAQNRFWKEYVKGNGKFTWKEFDEEIGKALERGGVHENAQIQAAAKFYRENLYNPILKEAREVNLPGLGTITDEQAMQYISRRTRKHLTAQDQQQMLEVLTENAEEQLTKTWQKKQELANAKALGREEQAADLELDADSVAALEDDLTARRAAIPAESAEVSELRDRIKELKAGVRTAATQAEKDALRDEVKRIEAENAELLGGAKLARAEATALTKRLRNLQHTFSRLGEKLSKQVAKIETEEAAQLATLTRAQRTAQKLLDNFSKLTDDEIEVGFEKVIAQIEKSERTFEKAQLRLDDLEGRSAEFRQLVDDDMVPTERVSKLQAAQTTRTERMQALRARMDNALDTKIGRREVLGEALEELNERTVRVIGKREVRLEAMRARAEIIDPANAAKQSARLRNEAGDIRGTFAADALEAGGVRTVSDAAGGTPRNMFAFRTRALELATTTHEKLMGEARGHPYFSILTEERGPEVARVLDIDPLHVWSNGRSYEEFLDRSVSNLSLRYQRTMGADIEIMRRFQELQPFNEGTSYTSAIKKDFRAARAKIQADAKLNPKQKTRQLAKLTKFEKQSVLDLQASLDRLRNTFGLPDDPNSLGYRAGRVLRNLNSLRMMGMVAISSMSDMARSTLKFGLTDTFKHGFAPLTQGIKGIKLTKRELNYAGTANDLSQHGRMAALTDAFDEVGFGTGLEQGLQSLTNNFGLVTGFSVWNTAQKHFVGNIVMGKIQDSLDIIAHGGTVKEVKDAQRFLASSGVDESLAKRMMSEMARPGGSEKINGILWPNTEAWAPDVARAYRAALAVNVDDAIVTPGLEIPIMANKSEIGRLISQFKTFTLSSTMKVVLAAAQDARAGNASQVLVGTAFSLGLGATSWWIASNLRGGKAKERFDNASYGQWVDEAIDRSGMLGVFAEGYSAAKRQPWLSDYVSFGGMPSTRRNYATSVGDLLGPTAAGIDDVFTIFNDLGDVKTRTVNAVRRLTPYNNVAYLSGGVTAVSDYVKNEMGLRQ